jgi:hypothetical protein
MRKTPPGEGGAMSRESENRQRDDSRRSPQAQADPPHERLWREWAARPPLNQRQSDALAKFGISRRAVILAGELAVWKICTVGGCYLPDPWGQAAIVVPIWHGPSPFDETPDDATWLQDLLAFRLGEPRLWWLRTGNSGVLGDEAYTRAIETAEPIWMHPTPLHWLRAGCQGAVLLDDLADRYGFGHVWEEAT